MSPEYRGEMGGRNAALVTYKDPKTGFWTGTLAPEDGGAFHLGEGIHVPIQRTEPLVLAEATANHGFSMKDTWPPAKRSLSFHIGQLKSFVSFGKWRRRA